MLSMCKETQKLALWFDIFLKKACVVFKKSPTFASAFGNEVLWEQLKRVH